MGLANANGPFGQQYAQGPVQQMTSAALNAQLQNKNSLQPTLKGASSVPNLVSNPSQLSPDQSKAL